MGNERALCVCVFRRVFTTTAIRAIDNDSVKWSDRNCDQMKMTRFKAKLIENLHHRLGAYFMQRYEAKAIPVAQSSNRWSLIHAEAEMKGKKKPHTQKKNNEILTKLVEFYCKQTHPSLFSALLVVHFSLVFCCVTCWTKRDTKINKIIV